MKGLNQRGIIISYMLYFISIAIVLAISKVKLCIQYVFEKTYFGFTKVDYTYYFTIEGGLFIVIFFVSKLLFILINSSSSLANFDSS